jgi:hypothetical protein
MAVVREYSIRGVGIVGHVTIAAEDHRILSLAEPRMAVLERATAPLPCST